MVEVVGTVDFESWFLGLTDAEAREVMNVVDKLEVMGLSLPFPHSSSIAGSSIALRELRCRSGASPLRVFYVFDPRRQAVVLIGGSKANDKSFYERMTKRSEEIYAKYLSETKE